MILYDSSDHGLSDGTGKGLGFAAREYYDCIGAIKYAKNTLKWEKIILIGTSIGGATVILAAAKEPSVDMVISENPFYSYEVFFYDIYNRVIRKGSLGKEVNKFGFFIDTLFKLSEYIPDSLLTSLAKFTRWYISASNEPNPIDVIDKISPRPILLIHSKQDVMIPYYHSTVLFEKALEPKEIWNPKKGFHADIYSIYNKDYEQKIIQFIKKI